MSKIKTPFIDDNAVNDLKIRLRNNLPLRARNSANTADVNILQISASDVLQILREMSMTNNKIVDLTDPTSPQDAATKAYVDAVAAGLSDPKDAARAATDGPLPAVTYNNGTSGEGATLTANANGALTAIDGITLIVGDRLLVKNQVSGLENGIYEVTQVGDAGTPFILTRTTDADNSDGVSSVSQGMFVPVSEGTVSGGLGYLMTSASSDVDPQGPLILGTDTLSFTQFGEVIVPGLGLTKTGQTLNIDNGDGLTFVGNALTINFDDADLVDGTNKAIGGILVGRRTFKETFVLSGTDISNGYIDLAKVASRDTILLQPDGGPKQNESVDYSVNYTGGTSSKTRVTFLGDLISGLITGSTVYVQYDSLDY